MKILIYANYNNDAICDRHHDFKSNFWVFLKNEKVKKNIYFEFYDPVSTYVHDFDIILCNFFNPIMERWGIPVVILDRMDSCLINTRNVYHLDSKVVKMICKEYIYKDISEYNNVYSEQRKHFRILSDCDNKIKKKLNIQNLDSKIKQLSWNFFQYSFICNPSMEIFRKMVIPEKKYDIFCVSHLHPKKVVLNKHRKKMHDIVFGLSDKYNIIQSPGNISKHDYIRYLSQSKLCIAPYGLGARIALDQYGLLSETIVIKPNMDFLYTEPNIYTDEFMEFVSTDWSNLEEKIDDIINNYDNNYKTKSINRRNMALKFDETYYCDKLIHTFNNIL